MTRECTNCGNSVSIRFARVYGDNAGEIHACFECMSSNDLLNGAGAFPDYEPEDQNRANYNSRSDGAKAARVPEVKFQR